MNSVLVKRIISTIQFNPKSKIAVKNFFLSGIILSLISGCSVNDNSNELPCQYIGFYYYNDAMNPLGEMSGDYILIGSDSINTDKALYDLIKSKSYFDQNYGFEIYKKGNNAYKFFVAKLSKTCDCNEIAWILNDMEKSVLINFAHYTINTDNCTGWTEETLGELCVDSYGNNFYVKVKDSTDLTDLNKVADETHTWIDHQDMYMPQWFALLADKHSKGDALAMANYFYETGLFEVCEPSIIKLAVK